jgi:Family of unknown function (DUF6502)
MPRRLDSTEGQQKDPLKDATVVTLRRVIDPLIELMFDTGVTVHEFNQLLRERAVRAAEKRVFKESGRRSRSRVAIATGLPRGEVARILDSADLSPKQRLGQHPVRKILAAWFDNPNFLTRNGEPAVLPIFGGRRSFEHLVALHCGGIPVRAMLDELTRIDAVERLSDQRVRAKSRLPILTGLSGTAVAAIGERTKDLLDTLTSNLRRASTPLFEGTALIGDADLELVSLIRREIAEQGENFINAANALFRRSRIAQNRPIARTKKKCRLGVTIYYFQDEIVNIEKTAKEIAPRKRKNLQRKKRYLPSDRILVRRRDSVAKDRQ